MPEWRRRFADLEASLARIPKELPAKPKAVLVISGHWEGPDFAVMSASRPPMIYDYSGFPPETYRVVYPAPGAPGIAVKAAELIRAAGLPTRLDDTRGFDHGAFVPLYIMYPNAETPVLQLSLQSGYDPARHFALGRALAPLRTEGVLIIGSGLSYHNLALFGPGARTPSETFDKWLSDALSSAPERRSASVMAWEQAPYARVCHPREDHLAPLFVALGAAENDTATQTYHERGLFGGVTATSYRFG
ncbi:MAG: dioxygenase [Hyphomicrobiales bacterium]|nr:MAG: dioxygenase [Hyphomicrobiales bacterium]